MVVKNVWLQSEALFRIRRQSYLLLENEAFSRQSAPIKHGRVSPSHR